MMAAILAGALLTGCGSTDATASDDEVSASPTDAGEPTPDTASPSAEDTDEEPDPDATGDAPAPDDDAEGWRYEESGTGARAERLASVESSSPAGEGEGPRSAVLTFRQHERDGAALYLDLPSGAVDCATGCRVSVVVDDSPPTEVEASREESDERRLSLDDAEALYSRVLGAGTVGFEVPVEGTGEVEVAFDVTGLDPEHFPGWS